MGVHKITADEGSLGAHAICFANCPKESYTESKGEYQIYHRANALSYSDAHPFLLEHPPMAMFINLRASPIRQAHIADIGLPCPAVRRVEARESCAE
jgi:hypothetical protein